MPGTRKGADHCCEALPRFSVARPHTYDRLFSSGCGALQKALLTLDFDGSPAQAQDSLAFHFLQKPRNDAASKVRNVGNLSLGCVDNGGIRYKFLMKPTKPCKNGAQPLASSAHHEILREPNCPSVGLERQKSQVPPSLGLRRRQPPKISDLDREDLTFPRRPDTRHSSLQPCDRSFTDPGTWVEKQALVGRTARLCRLCREASRDDAEEPPRRIPHCVEPSSFRQDPQPSNAQEIVLQARRKSRRPPGAARKRDSLFLINHTNLCPKADKRSTH
jgi:hypothetical protein